MTDTSDKDHKTRITRFRDSLSARFNLLEDKADDSVIDESLRNGVELKGATAWILMFAILICSVGLNVNSTAVIIGAMLISPLMGPIMGVGYGVGIYDFPLIRKSLLNLGIATLISLMTSTFYFTLTPLTEAQSELLARTSPTIWDVLIALFGGLAGIVGATRKEKSNVIPGVAIATALMPPLCTAGYSLANANWSYFFGAFYLFSINCVFIAVATGVVIGFLHLPHRKFVDPSIENRVKHILFAVVMATALPSLYLAYKLVDEELFSTRARQFVSREFRFDYAHVIETKISASARKIELTLIGQTIDEAELQRIKGHLEEAGLVGTGLIVHQAVETARIDESSLKAGIVKELYRDNQRILNEKDHLIKQLQQELSQSKARETATADIANELKAQYPHFTGIIIGEGLDSTEDSNTNRKTVGLLSAKSSKPVSDEDHRRIESWFKTRIKAVKVRILIEVPVEQKRRRNKQR